MPERTGVAETDGTDAWEDALDELESRAARAAAQTPLDGWNASASLPPLPAALAGRARDVQAAQQRAIGELEAEQQRVRTELESLSTVQAPRTEGGPPVYLDLLG